ncbi:MAG: LPS export ABC transporter periplasmic protein LptC [Tannerella sp.]|jgi:LPS export ABC transporter protein LptC|nr:LPS export ABC transporter periplasmic protein LptC [Tannerella sp.]
MTALTLFVLGSCNKGKNELIDFVFDNESSYTMSTTNSISYVSDTSGITRQKLEAKVWYSFDEASEPYWFFPEKIYGEQYDSLLNVEATFEADTAYYYFKKKLLKCINNVKVINLEGDQFETSLLFYDENEGKFYSDQFIRIIRGDYVNTGIGFESNHNLTKYRIFKATAEIPFQENTPADTVAIENQHSDLPPGE